MLQRNEQRPQCNNIPQMRGKAEGSGLLYSKQLSSP